MEKQIQSKPYKAGYIKEHKTRGWCTPRGAHTLSNNILLT